MGEAVRSYRAQDTDLHGSGDPDARGLEEHCRIHPLARCSVHKLWSTDHGGEELIGGQLPRPHQQLGVEVVGVGQPQTGRRRRR